ncbi:MAG: ABC transporter substrate-binding protein [Trueperaceae bacterium]|nr:ABC transporter substrate-binding protein [Trueperaceae bacterium]
MLHTVLRSPHPTAKAWARYAILLTSSILLLSAWAAPRAQGELLVYSILQEQDAEVLTRLFREQTGIDVQTIRASGGEMVARVMAERGAPRADVVLGGASNLHITMANEGVLAPYVSPASDYLEGATRDPEGYWTGFYLTALGIGINEERFRQQYGDRELPVTWEDLLDPAFAGEIVMTDPIASSTAYLFLQTQLQRLGWDAGWEYLEQLAPLVGQFPTSGSAPPRMVGTGEYTLGVAFVHSLSGTIDQGFPVSLVVPPGTGGEAGSVSIIAGGPNPENAQRFVDFMMSVEAQQVFTDQSFTTPLHPDVNLPSAAIPRASIDMIDFDAALAGEQREETLRRWEATLD